MRFRYTIVTIICFAALGASYGAGFMRGRLAQEDPFPVVTPVQITVNEGSGKPTDLDLTPLWESFKALRERFVDQSKIDVTRMLYGAIGGFVSSVGDPYTVFVAPQDQQKFVEDLQGSFGGIGAEIGVRKGVLLVIAPLEDSPAKKAGIKAGDRILKIDDTFSTDLSLDEAVSRIRGEVGTVVRLLILPENKEEPKDISVTRQTIVVPSLKYEVQDGIGIVRLLNFNADAAQAFGERVREIRQLPQKKLIIDVRDNPGGFLDVSQDIASWFLPRGEVVVYEVDQGGNRLPFVSKGYRGLEDFRVVVLMNKGSASASEILAGALRDGRGAKLVGEKSFGKGSVQELVDLSDGSIMKITVAKWVTPNGTSINDEGLQPDIAVAMPEDVSEDDADAKDPQMQKALELLK